MTPNEPGDSAMTEEQQFHASVVQLVRDILDAVQMDHSWTNTPGLAARVNALLCSSAPTPDSRASIAQSSQASAGGVCMPDDMRSYIEGMSVSVDVSTCEEDAGNRYFGTVSEVMDDSGEKHGVTLLVQTDVCANFAASIAPLPVSGSMEGIDHGRT